MGTTAAIVVMSNLVMINLVMINLVMINLVVKNLFDVESEKPGSPEGQRKTWIELSRLDGVDRLTGYLEGFSQPGLCPVAFCGKQHLEPVLHRYRHVPLKNDARNVTLMRINRSETPAFR